MKSYVDDIVVTDSNGEKAILYPNTKQEAVAGLIERFVNVEKPDITETTETTMPNSFYGRFLFKKIKGVGEQKQYSGKNQLPYPFYDTTKTIDGIDFTDNGDGSITVNGTATGNVSFIFSHRTDNSMVLGADTYIATGCPSGGNINTYRLSIARTNDSGTYEDIALDLGDGAEFTLEKETDLYVGFYIKEGTTFSNLVVKPMVRLASITDATWEPYVGGIASPSLSYPQEAISSVISKIKSHGKNQLPYPYSETTHTERGITWTDLGDGRVMANGTNTSTSFSWFAFATESTLWFEAGDYIVSGCPSGGSASTYYMRIANNDNTAIASDTGNGKSFTLKEDGYIRFSAVIAANATVNNLIFEPMIRKADIEDDTWECYKESTASIAFTGRAIEVSADYYYTYEKDEKYYVADSIERVDGGYQKIQRVRRFIFDGSENWTTNATFTGNVRFFMKDDTVPSSSDLGRSLWSKLMMCSHMQPCTSSSKQPYNDGETIAIHATNHLFQLYTPKYQDLDSWKAFLAEQYANGTPFTVDVIMSEPIVTPLPIEDQIALNRIETFDGITHMEFDSEIKPEFEGEYGTSKAGGYMLESLLTARNNDIRISSVEATVVNNI